MIPELRGLRTPPPSPLPQGEGEAADHHHGAHDERHVAPPAAAADDRSEEPDRPRHHRAGPFGVLDIGTTKIACLIGRTESDGTLRVLGFGWQRGRGVRAGGIVDLEEAERAIRACVGQAEDMADTRLRAVTVNLSCGQPESRLFNVQWPVGRPRRWTSTTSAACVVEGRARAESEGREVIHALPLTFSADETDGVVDPRGLYLHDADRAAARHRCGRDRAALAGRLHRALRPRNCRGGVGADGRRPGHAGGGRTANSAPP